MEKEYKISHDDLGTLIRAFYNWNVHRGIFIDSGAYSEGINMLLTDYEEEEQRIREEDDIAEEMKLYEQLKAKYEKK